MLARNVVKLVVERRRGLPFSRFRAKLVGALLGLDHHPGAAGADRRRRADPQQHAEVGQPAGRRGPQLGAADRPASTTASARTSSSATRRRWRGRSRPTMIRARDVDGIGRLLQTGVTPAGVRRVDVYELSGRRSRSASPRRTRPGDRRARRTRRATRWPPAWRRAAPASRISRWRAAASSCRPARSSSIRRPGSRGRRRRQRAAHRQADHRIAAHHRRLRELQPAALPDAAAAGHVPLALPDDDADDPRQRDVDGPLPGQAHHASGADAGRRARARSARAISITASSRRRATSSARSIEAFNSMAAELRQPASSTADRAEEPAARGPPPLHRDDSGAHRHGRGLDRRRRAHRNDQRRRLPAARGGSHRHRHAGRAAVRARRSPPARARCCTRRTRRAGTRRRTRSRWPATAGNCTWRRRRRRCRARTAWRPAPCSCSTT